MCTIGIHRLDEDDYVLFKNKDFGRTAFEDRIILEWGLFGVAGVSTWAGSDPALDVFSGISVGANAAGLLCCDANVQGATGQANYDELVEIALRASEGVGGAIAAIRTAVASRPYLWGNLIMIDGVGEAAVEVRDQEVAVKRLSGPTARSNHHLTLGTPGEADASGTTQSRLECAQRRVESATTVDDIFALQRAHDDGTTGICSHQGHQTVYSYVLRRRGGATTLHVTKGHPCEAGRVDLTVPIGDRWSPSAAAEFLAAYPSNEVTIEA